MENLAVGMYVVTRGQSSGRIVDWRLDAGGAWWLVKLSGGQVIWMKAGALRPAANA